MDFVIALLALTGFASAMVAVGRWMDSRRSSYRARYHWRR
jgi:hypothetical protein